jgi:hypothetical protein
MFSDLKLAVRKLSKSPGFALTAIATLALGIGANAVVFSVLNALILRSVNVPHAQNLYTVQRYKYPSQSYPDYLDLRDRNRTFESLVTFQIIGPVGLDTGVNPSVAWPYLASGNYFDALEIQPYLGRFFHASDEKGMNSAPYVVLSYSYWHSYFHGDPGVVGRMASINKHPFTIIGVAPPAFRGTELFFSPALWIPIVEHPVVTGSDGMKYRGNHSPFVLGRLKGMAFQGLSARRRGADIFAGSSRADRRHAGRAGKSVHGRPDAADRADSAGSMRQPGQPVCGACGGPGKRGSPAAGAGIAALVDPAATADRGGAGFSGRRRGWTGRRRGDAARAERVATDSGCPDQRTGES